MDTPNTTKIRTSVRIPILPKGTKPCRKYAQALERAIGADGCTGVTEMYHECCIFHDLGYRYHIDVYGEEITKDKVDSNFKKCIQSRSWMKWFNPVSWWRYAGVKWFGDKFYSIYPKEFETYQFKIEGEK
jgi:hypothetical protein